MTESLAEPLGLGDRELVAFVGAGGKSTLLFRLGDELASAGATVLLTTTTKMGSDQAKRVRCVSPDEVLAARLEPGPVMVVAEDDGHKVTGPSPEGVDVLFAASHARYVLVEADGARGRSFKTPAEHEPVIPSTTTLVVIVVGADAIGRPIAEKCHRPELVAKLAGLSVHDTLDVDAAVRVLTHPEGLLRAVPAGARVVGVVTKAEPGGVGALLVSALARSERMQRVVMVP